MERISIFNYEAFYLDYLEGNLGDEDVRMLMEFFEEHPECRLESEDIVALEVPESITYSGKSALKQTDESDVITHANVEHFLIAEQEGILSDAKISELNQLVATDESLKSARKRYEAVYFTADSSVVYGNKKGLKQRKTIVLWPYASTVAAAAIVFVLFNLNMDAITPPAVDFSVPTWNALRPEVQSGDTNEVNVEPREVIIAKTDERKSLKSESKSNRISDAIEGSRLKTKVAKGVLSTYGEQELQPITAMSYNPNHSEGGLEDPLRGFGPEGDLAKMNNPIEPITKFIAKKSNTDVEYGQRKADDSNKGGFFLKIGGFEISRNKH